MWVIYLWPPDAKNWLIWKDPDAGKDWGQEEGTSEDEMVGWHHLVKDMGLGGLRQLVMDMEAWHAGVMGSQKVGHDWATKLIKHSVNATKQNDLFKY